MTPKIISLGLYQLGYPGGGGGSIVWGLGFWLGKDILGFFKNCDLDNSYGVAKMIHMDN